ncbi:MAG TPA: orotidine-5'-phosphate decarboxylase [Deltaproteobacteria bacterium]|nr:orotidine-5'-phosphate decarboxylase [Deltaproteobacteria bacterium]
MLNNKASEKLIFALDTKSYDEALSWVELLSGHVGMFKIGKGLFTSAGPKIVEEIKKRGQRVFLDLKFHDIPNTVARAVEAAMEYDVDMLNVHASGGSEMIRQAVLAATAFAEKQKKSKPVILAVTVLTSLDDADLDEIGFKSEVDDLVINLAKLAKEAGADGVVASPVDIINLRKSFGDDFVVVTPGVRVAADASRDDQKRTLSATEAIKAGSDYIVVGRPIREADQPLNACLKIIQEIEDALSVK